jgi:hypothetical protein
MAHGYTRRWDEGWDVKNQIFRHFESIAFRAPIKNQKTECAVSPGACDALIP